MTLLFVNRTQEYGDLLALGKDGFTESGGVEVEKGGIKTRVHQPFRDSSSMARVHAITSDCGGG